MYRTRPFLLGVVLAGVTSLSAVPGTAQAADPITVFAPATQPASTQPIQPIANAPDPSAAIDAYARAVAAGGDRVALEDAFVRRMVDFGVPEMAASQAADLNRSAPENRLAWAVTSYVESRKGNFNSAIDHLVRAAQKAPDDLFIQRTAGQMVAWYQTQADRSRISDDLQRALTDVQNKLAQRPAFALAYQDARLSYGASTDVVAPTTAPSTATVRPHSIYDDDAMSSTYSYPASNYIASPTPGYDYYGYGYPAYSYPAYGYYGYPAYSSSCWWSPGFTCWGAGVVIINNHNHHGFDHFHHFDHFGFDHNHNFVFGHDAFGNGFRNDGFRNDGFRNDGFRNDGFRNDGFNRGGGIATSRTGLDRFGSSQFDPIRGFSGGFGRGMPTGGSASFRQPVGSPVFTRSGFRSGPIVGPMPQAGAPSPTVTRSAPAGGSSGGMHHR